MKLTIIPLLFFSLLFSTEKVLTAAMEDEIPEHNSKQEVEYTAMQDETPIIDAIREGESIEAIKKMISNGNVNEKDENGDTPLIWACRLERKDGKEKKLVKTLLSHNADITSKNKDNLSAFSLTNNDEIKDLVLNKMLLLISKVNISDEKMDQLNDFICRINDSIILENLPRKTKKRKIPSSEQEQNNRMAKKIFRLIEEHFA
ncbi:MAG: ankyrin repeat domain-containing protein [Candidatus Babeliales bacterium]